MRTVAQHIALMEHAVGSDKDDDTRHDFYASFNRAGRLLTLRRHWWWRLVPGVSLPAVVSSANISLPSDFESLQKIVLSSGQGPVTCLTPDEYTDALASVGSSSIPSGTLICLPISTFNTTTGAETKVLKLLSAATANGSPTFVCTYWRDWTDFTSSDGAKFPAIPQRFDDALMLIARACAMDLQDQAESHEMVCFERAIALLESQDTSTVPEFSPPRGGANDRLRRIRLDGPASFV